MSLLLKTLPRPPHLILSKGQVLPVPGPSPIATSCSLWSYLLHLHHSFLCPSLWPSRGPSETPGTWQPWGSEPAVPSARHAFPPANAVTSLKSLIKCPLLNGALSVRPIRSHHLPLPCTLLISFILLDFLPQYRTPSSSL